MSAQCAVPENITNTISSIVLLLYDFLFIAKILPESRLLSRSSTTIGSYQNLGGTGAQLKKKSALVLYKIKSTLCVGHIYQPIYDLESGTKLLDRFSLNFLWEMFTKCCYAVLSFSLTDPE